MSFGIRTKLTFLYTFLLGVCLIFFGFFLYFTLSRSLLDNTDRRIRTVAETISKTALRPSSALGIPKHFDLILERFFGIKTSGKFIQIMDGSGKVIYQSSSLKGFELPLSKETLHNALGGKMTFETIRLAGGEKVRVAVYPVRERGELISLVQIGTSLRTVQDTLKSLLYILYIATSVALILAGIIGWLLASRALKPVDEITKTARQIGAKSLDQRLVMKGPRDEIGRLVETFNEMISRLESSFNRTKQFTADASHELRTPLTILKGETEIALKTEKSVKGLRAVLKSNLEEINHLVDMVKKLLFLSKEDAGIRDMPVETVELDKLLLEKYKQVKRLAEEKGINMSLVKNDEVSVKGDPYRLRELLLNLIENAVKYTPTGGDVTLTLEGSNGFAKVIVADTGIGISKEDCPHVFERFYRVDKARVRSEGGSGLGLNICKQIVEAHKGGIELKSELGKGSAFIVHLPVC